MRTPRSLVVLAGLALLTAACGSGGDDAAETTSTTVAAPTTTTTTTETSPETAAPESVPETTVPDQTDPAEATDGGADGSADPDGIDLEGVTGVCLEASQAMAAAVASYTTGLAGAFDGSLDDESLQQAAGQLEAMAGAAPPEIRGDLEVIAGEVQKFYEALAETGYEPGVTPTPDQMAALSGLAEVIDEEAYEEASTNVEAWFEENC